MHIYLNLNRRRENYFNKNIGPHIKKVSFRTSCLLMGTFDCFYDVRLSNLRKK